MATGVVLGGGGVVGVAWHEGALAALKDAGLDVLGDAGTIVGTSAGSIVGAQAATGITAGADVSPPPMEPDLELLGVVFTQWMAIDTMTEDAAKAVCQLAMGAK